VRSVPDITPSHQHQVPDVVIDFVLDEAGASTDVDRLGQVGFVARRFRIDPRINSAARGIESLASLKERDDLKS